MKTVLYISLLVVLGSMSYLLFQTPSANATNSQLECAKNMPTLSTHQYLAMFWLIGAQAIFPPLIQSSSRPDAYAIIAWGVLIVALQILFTPVLLRLPPLRRWYGWSDALSDRQRQALAQRNLHRYYQVAENEGYMGRVMPYMWRITWSLCVLAALTTVALPSDTGWPAVDAVAAFSLWYPLGVLVLILASCPLGRMRKTKA